MSVSSSSISTAAGLLAANPGLAAHGSLADAVGSAVIDVVVDTASFVAVGTLHPFAGWIAQALGSFQELMTSLTGDSTAILAHASHLSDTASQVEAQIPAVESGTSTASGCWAGGAASAFVVTADATVDCLRSTSDVLRFASQGHLSLMGLLAGCKDGTLTLVTQLATDLCLAVGRFLAQMGLTVIGGVVGVVSSTVGGAVSGAGRGAAQGWQRGGLRGAVTGFFSGGAHGAVESAAEAAQRAQLALQEAFASFVRWAASHVSTVLDQVYAFVESHVEPMVSVVGQMSGAGERAHRAAALLRGQGDPGADTDRPAAGTYGAVTQGAQPQGRDDELIMLNETITNFSVPLPAGYARLSDGELDAIGLNRAMLHDVNGFIAEAYRTPDGGYVVAFGGTSVGPGGSRPDYIEDVVGGATVSPHTQQVLAIAGALERGGHGDQVAYTGHSLGGRLAGVAALATGSSAITYNAAGVSQATVDYIAHRNGVDPDTLLQRANDGQVRRYYTGDDPLTAAQERFSETGDRMPDAVGAPVLLSPLETADPFLDPSVGLDPYQGHHIDPIIKAWHDKYGTNGELIP